MRRGIGRAGFTLIELMIVYVMMGILAGMAIAPLSRALDRAAAARVVADARTVQLATRSFLESGGTLPASGNWGETPTGLGGFLEEGMAFTFRDAEYLFVTQPLVGKAQLWVRYPLGSRLGEALMGFRNGTTITWTPTRATFQLAE